MMCGSILQEILSKGKGPHCIKPNKKIVTILPRIIRLLKQWALKISQPPLPSQGGGEGTQNSSWEKRPQAVNFLEFQRVSFAGLLNYTLGLGRPLDLWIPFLSVLVMV